MLPTLGLAVLSRDGGSTAGGVCSDISGCFVLFCFVLILLNFGLFGGQRS